VISAISFEMIPLSQGKKIFNTQSSPTATCIFRMSIDTSILSVKEYSPSESHLFLLYSAEQSCNFHHKLMLSVLVLKKEFPEVC
jgi:hypothetical protein